MCLILTRQEINMIIRGLHELALVSPKDMMEVGVFLALLADNPDCTVWMITEED